MLRNLTSRLLGDRLKDSASPNDSTKAENQNLENIRSLKSPSPPKGSASKHKTGMRPKKAAMKTSKRTPTSQRLNRLSTGFRSPTPRDAAAIGRLQRAVFDRNQSTFAVASIPDATTTLLPFTPSQAVGQVIHVMFNNEAEKKLAFYRGRVKKYHPNQGTHTIHYDDGDKITQNLTTQTIIWPDGTITAIERSIIKENGDMDIVEVDVPPSWPPQQQDAPPPLLTSEPQFPVDKIPTATAVIMPFSPKGAIGRTIHVLFNEGSLTFYKGKITKYDPGTGRHTLHFTVDQTSDDFDLTKDTVIWPGDIITAYEKSATMSNGEMRILLCEKRPSWPEEEVEEQEEEEEEEQEEEEEEEEEKELDLTKPVITFETIPAGTSHTLPFPKSKVTGQTVHVMFKVVDEDKGDNTIFEFYRGTVGTASGTRFYIEYEDGSDSGYYWLHRETIIWGDGTITAFERSVKNRKGEVAIVQVETPIVWPDDEEEEEEEMLGTPNDAGDVNAGCSAVLMQPSFTIQVIPEATGTTIPYTREEAIERAVQVLFKIEDGQRKFYRGIIKSYSQATGKHTIIFDEGGYRRLDLTEQTIIWPSHKVVIKGVETETITATETSVVRKFGIVEIQTTDTRPTWPPHDPASLPSLSGGQPGEKVQYDVSKVSFSVDLIPVATTKTMPCAFSQAIGQTIHILVYQNKKLLFKRGLITNVSEASKTHTVAFEGGGDQVELSLDERTIIWPGGVITSSQRVVETTNEISLVTIEEKKPSWPADDVQKRRGGGGGGGRRRGILEQGAGEGMVAGKGEDAAAAGGNGNGDGGEDEIDTSKAIFLVSKIPEATAYIIPHTPSEAEGLQIHVMHEEEEGTDQSRPSIKFYQGIVRTYDKKSGEHFVAFCDGEEYNLKLDEETVIWPDGTITANEVSVLNKDGRHKRIARAKTLPAWPQEEEEEPHNYDVSLSTIKLNHVPIATAQVIPYTPAEAVNKKIHVMFKAKNNKSGVEFYRGTIKKLEPSCSGGGGNNRGPEHYIVFDDNEKSSLTLVDETIIWDNGTITAAETAEEKDGVLVFQNCRPKPSWPDSGEVEVEVFANDVGEWDLSKEWISVEAIPKPTTFTMPYSRAAAVDKTVFVFFDRRGAYELLRGTISTYNRGNGSHTVEFTDGDTLDCQLHKEAAVIWPGKVITCGEKSVRKGDAIILKRADTLPKWPQNQRGTSVKFSLDDSKYPLKKLKQRSFPVDKIPSPTTYEMPFTPEQAVHQTVHVAFKETKKGGSTVNILKFYRGEITAYHPNSGKHTVAFEDGQIVRYNLVNETVIWSDGTVTCGEQSSFDKRTGRIQIKPADDMPSWPLSGKKGRRSSTAVTPGHQGKKIQLTTTGMKFHNNNNNSRKREGEPIFTTTDDGMVVAAATTKQAEPVRHQVDTMTLGGVTFKVGDAVYVVSNEQMLEEINQAEEGQLTGLDKHLFHCGVCGSDACDEEAHAMVECGRCLQGYHLACLDPPLTEVPERDWVCSKCAAGKKAPSRRACCARDYFLQNRGLSLARVDTIWRVTMDEDDGHINDGSCSYEFTGRWYCLPEETHCGRQPEHAAREVFLSFNQDLVDASSILRPAKVLSPGHFNTDRSGDEDMYVCEYAYDAVWQRFRRVSDVGKDEDDDEEEEEEYDLEDGEDDGDVDDDEEEGEGWKTGTATVGKTKALRISGGLLDLAATTTAGKLKSGKGGGGNSKRRASSTAGFLGGSSRFKRGASKYAGLDGDDDDEGKDATFRAADAVADHRGRGWMANIRKTGGKRKLQGGEGGELLLKRGRIDGGAGDEGNNSNQHQQQQQEQRQKQQYDDDTPASRLNRARHQLTLAVVPESLPCREVERTEIYTFVESAIRGGDAGGSCLYVSGIPGTGKTATVMEVMRTMQRLSDCGDMPAFQFVELNGLRLPSPQHAYTALYEALSGKKVGPAAAVAALEEVLGIKGRRGHVVVDRPVIVLVDEMDLLINKNQSVLYNLFDWPSREGSRLNIIGVANTMDLPERLHPRIGSRLAGRRVVFHPYSRAQLENIVNSRLQAVGEGAFDPGAVSYMARKVANCSGDLRRCLELCRRAAEIAEAELHRSLNGGGSGGEGQQQQQQQGDGVDNDNNKSQDQDQGQPSTTTSIITGKVTTAHANTAIQEMFNTPHVRMLQGASRLERIILASMLLEARYSGCSESTLGDIAERLYGLCKGNGEPQPPFGTILQVVTSLSAKRLIICLDSLNKRVHAKLTLNVPSYDLIHVLGGDEKIPWLANRVNSAS